MLFRVGSLFVLGRSFRWRLVQRIPSVWSLFFKFVLLGLLDITEQLGMGVLFDAPFVGCKWKVRTHLFVGASCEDKA